MHLIGQLGITSARVEPTSTLFLLELPEHQLLPAALILTHCGSSDCVELLL